MPLHPGFIGSNIIPDLVFDGGYCAYAPYDTSRIRPSQCMRDPPICF